MSEVEPWSINSDGKVLLVICRAVVPEKLLAVGRIGREGGRAIIADVPTKQVWISENKKKSSEKPYQDMQNDAVKWLTVGNMPAS